MSGADDAAVLREQLDDAPCGLLTLDADEVVTSVNSAVLQWLERARDDVVGRRFTQLLAPGSRVYHETHVGALLQLRGEAREVAVSLLRADGARLPALMSARRRPADGARPPRTLVTLFDASDRTRYEADLRAARARAERATARLVRLEEVVAELSGAADLAAVRAVIRTATHRTFPDRSHVWLGDDGPLPVGPADDLADGLVVVAPVGTARDRFAWLPAAPPAAEFVIVVPLTAHDELLGLAAVFSSTAPDPDDLAILQTIGRQAGVSLDRARLGDEHRHASLTLQRSLLPPALPQDARHQIATLYRPGTARLEVGGDWYDAFGVGRDRLMVVVGDVVGRGVHAAAAMGQLRSAIRAVALIDPAPAAVLAHLDAFVAGVPHARTATVTVALVDLGTGRLRLASAGHPPPVLASGRRARLLWEGRSTPLGARFGDASRPEAEMVMAPGDCLVAYTDGVVERRSGDLGGQLDALAAAVGAHHDVPLPAMLDAAVGTLLAGTAAEDDVCALALTLQPQPCWRHVVDAAAPRLSALREGLTAWLATLGTPRDEGELVVLACSEAVANAIEHGGAGTVDVLATLDGALLRVRVEDDGSWRPPTASDDRGHGLQIMRAAMTAVEVTPGRGTVVAMHRRLRLGNGA